jgi:hypothetical protein
MTPCDSLDGYKHLCPENWDRKALLNIIIYVTNIFIHIPKSVTIIKKLMCGW